MRDGKRPFKDIHPMTHFFQFIDYINALRIQSPLNDWIFRQLSFEQKQIYPN
jgi:hypothetical protein